MKGWRRYCTEKRSRLWKTTPPVWIVAGTVKFALFSEMLIKFNSLIITSDFDKDTLVSWIGIVYNAKRLVIIDQGTAEKIRREWLRIIAVGYGDYGKLRASYFTVDYGDYGRERYCRLLRLQNWKS